MTKIILLASIVSASLVAAAVPSQAREFSVWGNNFTTDDGSAALSSPPAPSFRATVEHPGRYRRGNHRIEDPTR